MRQRVVITAMEVASAIGTGVGDFWQALIQGTSGISRITRYDPSPYPTQIAGEVQRFDLSRYPQFQKPKRYAFATQMALYCAASAISQSELTQKELEKAGTFIGTGLGGTPQSESAYQLFYQQGWKKVPALTITRGMPNSIANVVAIESGLKGKNLTISNACNSSAEAIGLAFEQIQSGKLPLAICGGSESMVWESIMSAWCKLRVMSTQNETPEKAMRPFDKGRDGMVMADGAAVLVLEAYDHARARGATPIAEIIGFGSSCDAHHITAPCSEGQAQAVINALDDAKTSTNDVHYINAHGTATQLNDTVETQTIKTVFGSHASSLAVSSIKSMLGHTIGAAGAIEIASTALTLKHQCIPPTINLTEADPDCDLDYVPNQARHRTVDIALSQHFAFGGANCALVLRRW